MEDDSMFYTKRGAVERRVEGAGDPKLRAQVRWIFWIAAGYGLMALLPMYLRPPAGLSHPEFFYGFVGVACAWQIAFLVVAQDPWRYRPMIIPAILEKLGFGVAALVLHAQDRVSTLIALGGAVDLVMAAAFAWAFIVLSRSRE